MGGWQILDSDGEPTGYAMGSTVVERASREGYSSGDNYDEASEDLLPCVDDDPSINPFADAAGQEKVSSSSIDGEVIELREKVRERIRRASIAGTL